MSLIPKRLFRQMALLSHFPTERQTDRYKFNPPYISKRTVFSNRAFSRAIGLSALFISVFLPIFTYARKGELILVQEVRDPGNSQTSLALEAARNIDPSASVGGRDLPPADSTALAADTAPVESFVESGNSGFGEISVYVVKEGDTLGQIAEKFGVSQNTILWANDIKNVNTIRPGQELVILPISGVRHEVKSGETLSGIAKKYKVDMADILSYNDITADKIKPGQTLVIPGGQVSVSSSVASKPAVSSSVSVASAPSVAGYFIRPISGGVKSQGVHGNNAVDIAAPVGTSIVASASGKVVVSRTGGYNGGYGTYVVLSHDNGTQTLYAHMASNNVAVGQTVSQGEKIGTIGMTGRTTGPHLHFEVRGAKNPF